MNTDDKSSYLCLDSQRLRDSSHLSTNLLLQADENGPSAPFHAASRLRDFFKRRLTGKNYCIHIRRKDEPGRSAVVKPPPLHFFADPFLYETGDGVQLFFEDFDFLRGRGHLSTIHLDENLQASKVDRVFSTPYHLSYPSVFQHSDLLYMLPEMSATKSITLYKCVRFPTVWEPMTIILSNIDAADSTLLYHDERFWLFTSVRTNLAQNRYLNIYSADSLSSVEWEPHPINQRRLYHDLSYQSGRCAGAFFWKDGSLMRPCQLNRSIYGEGVLLQKVSRLTRDEFREHSVGRVVCPMPGYSHHYCQSDRYETVDVHSPIKLSTALFYAALRLGSRLLRAKG